MRHQAFLQMMSLTAFAALLAGCGHANPAAKPVDALAASAASAALANAVQADTSTPTSNDDDGADDSTPKPKATYCTTLQLAPIQQADVDSYLDLMRAAAARVQNPTAADLDAIRRESAYEKQAAADSEANAPAQEAMEAKQQQLQAQMQDAMNHGDLAKAKQLADQQMQQLKAATAAVRTPPTLDDATMQTATDLTHGNADRVVARERHFDEDRWDCIVDAIEEVFPPPTAIVGDCDADCAPQLTPEQLKREHEHEQVLKRNRQILAAYAKTIRALQAIVRNGKV